jgi:predicted metal-dependent peptidase
MDTSGSMERQLIQSIVDEINGILYLRKVKEIVVLFFDTKIHEPQIIAGNESAYCPAVIGGGGTNFQVPLDYINEEFDDNISLCLFFTDGYEAIPLEPSYGDKFIWIVYDNPNWPNSQHVGNNPLFGKKILVNSKSLKASTQSPTNESVAFFGRLVTENIKNYLR